MNNRRADLKNGDFEVVYEETKAMFPSYPHEVNYNSYIPFEYPDVKDKEVNAALESAWLSDLI